MATGPAAPTPPSLLHRATVVVAESLDIGDIVADLDLLPTQPRRVLWRHLTDERLRRLEHCLLTTTPPHSPHHALDGDSGTTAQVMSMRFPQYEAELQGEWHARCRRASVAITENESEDARRVFWEHHFRHRHLRRAVSSGKDDAADGGRVELELYEDVVQSLRAHARELVPRLTPVLVRLPRLERLELHHLNEQQRAAWSSLDVILSASPALDSLGFFHGRLSGPRLDEVARALCGRVANKQPPVTHLEFVSVKFKSASDHQRLTVLVDACRDLRDVRISSTISDFENRALLDALLRQRHLRKLSLEHNDLEDEAFAGLKDENLDSPLSLRHLRLNNNAISARTIRVITSAMSSGLLMLESLELRNNMDLGDPGILALTPMLTLRNSTLTQLDIRNCHFGLEGVSTLLMALAGDRTLLSLDLSQNFFGNAFGDVLAEFLTRNQTLQQLAINYVGLGHAGCTPQLLTALTRNTSLRHLSIGANRLRDQGVTLILDAISQRGRHQPYDTLDISGNLLTVDGIQGFVEILDQHSVLTTQAPEPTQKRRRLLDDSTKPWGIDTQRGSATTAFVIRELSILNNDLAADPPRVQEVLQQIQMRVRVLHSNEWASHRNVYDDEV